MGDLIAERYRVRSVLGQGGAGITFAVEDVHTHQSYALKVLSLKGIQDWKQLELFEREAKTLSQLDHPAIPNYIDYFQADTAGNRWFYIVQELVPGHSLAELVQQGWRANQTEVRQLALQILDILKYLHELTPPIIHRDIKPQNIIRNGDGQIYLVDFGAVQNVYHNTMVGSTVVGTYGYMAPEHFQGKAVPATDLYSLGATLLFLLTHCSPADLPQKRLKIDFRSVVHLEPAFADWLDQMLEPALEDRFVSARDAMDGLTAPPRRVKPPAKPRSRTPRRQPRGSKVTLKRTETQLIVDIPPTGLRVQTLGMGCFVVFWNGGVLAGTFACFAVGNFAILPFFIPFWIMGSILVGLTLCGIASSTHLEINPLTFELVWQIKSLGLRYRRSGRTLEIKQVKRTDAYNINDRPVQGCTLLEGSKKHKFGTMLSPSEQAWLMEEISDFLRLRNR
ncbi:serine/threonine protein kinase [Acaryochloris marina]|nr:serine/threonine-protein kinase [Acaryochloris marina]